MAGEVLQRHIMLCRIRNKGPPVFQRNIIECNWLEIWWIFGLSKQMRSHLLDHKYKYKNGLCSAAAFIHSHPLHLSVFVQTFEQNKAISPIEHRGTQKSFLQFATNKRSNSFTSKSQSRIGLGQNYSVWIFKTIENNQKFVLKTPILQR